MSTTTIKPTVGRVVLIFFAAAASGAMEGYALPTTSDTPVPGLVTRVHGDSCINVAAFDANGANLPLMSVRLLQEGDERPTSGCWAEWMPYQRDQAKKHADEVARADEPKAPGLPPHQQRVLDERDALNEKIAKLAAFFDTTIFAGLDEAEKSRLERQEEAMVAYSKILDERIAAFTSAASTTV